MICCVTNCPCLYTALPFTLTENWLLFDNRMNYTAMISMCEMLGDMYELALTTIVIMNMQGRVFYTYC